MNTTMIPEVSDVLQKNIQGLVKKHKAELVHRASASIGGRMGVFTTLFKGYEFKLRYDATTAGKITVLSATPFADQPVWA